MPSFDIVSQYDMQELDNAVNMAKRDIANRYDLKGTKANIELNKSEEIIRLDADNDFHLDAVRDLLEKRTVGRKLSLKIFDKREVEAASGMAVRQQIKLKKGIDKDNATRLNKMIKTMKLKVQSQIQGDQLRVTGKKIDELQKVIAVVKSADINIHVEFVNMKS